ncbi:uncharacterized protein LOC135337310 isoform X1 [Halichondria panicea]|uniref:uncharacterized protein LOC135337310 isoform X1 n=1 Tax=Halichondria panicea TaxID=6063 RepID=UPI00312B8AE8
MLSRSILSWLVLLTLATVTRSEHYHIVPVDSTDLCNDYRNGTCFTLEQLVQTDLLSGGDNLTLSFLPGDHVLTEQLLIRNFLHVQITGQNTSTTVVGFHSNGTIRFVSNTKLNIECLSFVGANDRPQNSHQGLIIDGANDVYIKDCYFSDFVSLNQAETHVVKIVNTQTVTIESNLFINNTGRALHVEADDAYITNSVFTRNDDGGGAVDDLILNGRLKYNSSWSRGAVEVVSGIVVITRCNFTNNKASVWGGAIVVVASNVSISNSILINNSGGGAIGVVLASVSIFGCSLTNNRATNNGEVIGGGAIDVVRGSVSISNSELTNNSADYGGAIRVYSGSVSISNSELTNNRACNGGGAIRVDLGSSVSLSNSELTNNSAGYGGAISVYSISNVSISNSELTNNRFDYGGAIDVDSGSVSISNCELTNNRADYGGAINVDSGSVSISNCELTNNRAKYSGGAIYVHPGSVSIFNSELINNSADWGGAISVYSGSSVYISNSELTHNSAYNRGGAIDVYSSSVSIFNSKLTNNSSAYYSGGAIYVDSGSVSIFNSNLTNNSAYSGGGAIYVFSSSSASISNSTLTHNSANYSGGAINVVSGSVSIFNSGGAINVVSGSVSIFNSNLTNNSAYSGGGAIYVFSGSVSISNSTLTHNFAKENGVIDVIVSRFSTLIINNTDITNNTGSLNIAQSNVTFTGMNIIGNNGRPIYAFNSRIEFNGPTTLSNNQGVFGGAISADESQIYINTEGFIITNNTATSGGGVFLRESTLFVNVPIKIYHNTAQNGGGIYAYSSRVEFQPVQMEEPRPPNKQSEIAHNVAENNGGGIHAVSSTIELTHSHVNIDSNTANTSGGGVYLQQSKLYLFKKDEEDNLSQVRYVKLIINNNSAQYGGGIFVADDTESSACKEGATETETIFADCFIQTIKLHAHESFSDQNYFNTFMTKNTVTQSGADIYGGLLDRCTASQNAEYHISSNGLDYIQNTVNSSIEPLSISSRPIQVILCNYSQYDYVSTKKGHTFTISVMAVDQVGNPMNATIRSSVVSESGRDRLKEGQAKHEIGNQCTELEYNVFSQDSSAQVELYAEGPCINLGISKQLINISFELCTCPIGLKPIQSDIECKCDCDPNLLQYQVTNCSEENGTIKLESNNNIWIEVINTTNGSRYVVSNCTFDYCVQKSVNISLSNPDEQCAYNRSGVLCGECEPGLSLVLATSRCERCSDNYLLLLIPFALAGILLVALILVLNITIATGNIHGLIFYTNIVAANKAIFFPSLNNFLTVFISWVNLDLGIETCFYNGMNSQGKVLLQLVFPAYLFLLMFFIIIISKYFDSFAKLLSNRNPVAALGTLVLLSYSKLLRFVIAALQHRVLDYPDGTSDIVWVYDGNVQYFVRDHLPRFVAAAIILIAGGLFTVLLFFGQWFPRCSKVMIWTKNTKYIGFMDAYHAPFTPKHRYWVGLLLFALIAHNLVAAMALDTYLPILSSGAVSVGLIGWKLLNNRLYKSKICDSLKSLYLLNVAMLAFGTFYVKDTKNSQSALANTSMAISFTLFVITLCYHFYQFVLKKSNTWLKIEDTIRNLGAGAADMRLRRANNAREMYQLVADENDEDELLQAVDDYEQRDALNLPYTDGAVEEADPDRYITPPIIRPATRPDQLRLSYMDDLAPLTTEDYRPAPPPPRANHRPAVTHTEIGPIRNEV